MPRGQAGVTKVHYKGSTEDFIVFVESVEDYEKWKGDRSVPLAQVVDSFKIFITHKHGAQGQLDGASKQTLQNEFGSSKEEDAIIKILESGSMQQVENLPNHPGRSGDRNETMGGGRMAH
ncbi:hypothetical protein LTR64_006684 [Lithohypha guttulata]|uniref:Ribosome maturation protein SDO1/SBDS N-terminal domain-containing protein n=1 Tax=Lithohypha guttulata TaxID=1690604 RepID=A0AAN7TEL3_9EURO|nr:hypothetical protein LTR51_004756 [Lithohypha guttulata]KAK5091364.1 hypothetical protein LTR05_001547 [Lithohypha guttulata]